jgi:uncharacterized phage protein (TIGR01671 family)
MKQTIKFRAWDKEKKVMGNVIAWTPDLVQMQFTGLKDKSGREIYQGDILKIEANKEGYGETSYSGYVEVVAHTCGYSFRLFNPSEKEMDERCIPWDSTSLWHINDPEYVEVIGNIYENPELIKKK